MTPAPTPPTGFRLVKGSELKAPFDPKLLNWRDNKNKWQTSTYAGCATGNLITNDCDDWYAIPDHVDRDIHGNITDKFADVPVAPDGFRLVHKNALKVPISITTKYFDGEWKDCWFNQDYAMLDTPPEWYAIDNGYVKTPPDCPQSLLDAAKKIIEERGKDYGDINQSFNRIAKFWSAYKGVEITPKDVAAMMMLLKISRWVTSDKPDTLLDIVGYAECAEKLNKAEV